MPVTYSAHVVRRIRQAFKANPDDPIREAIFYLADRDFRLKDRKLRKATKKK
jgi:hypothetical protein